MDLSDRRLPGRWWRCIVVGVGLLAGCHAEHPQSILHPASSASGAIAWLWWFLFAVCGAISVIVMVLTVWAVVLPRQENAHAAWKQPFILIAGGVIPSIILVVILILSVGTQKALESPQTDLTVRLTGHQWWWEVEYPDQQIYTANEIHIPVGKPVRIELLTADVIHSLWIPNLQGKTDMIPEKMNVTWIQADRAGTYRAQCAEYCGVQHALMALLVVALPENEFEQWVAERQQADPTPTTGAEERGKAVFVKAECNNCHRVGEEPAKTKRGPNLTHIGSRQSLGAGILPNDRENLERWIRDPQSIKPGNLMPQTPLQQDDLSDLTTYLESLK